MNLKRLWSGLVLVSLISVCRAADFPLLRNPVTSEDRSLMLHPERYKSVDEVEGRIQAIDLTASAVVLEDALDHQWKIHVDADTPISDTNHPNISIGDLKENQKIRVYYTPADMHARQVDVIARPFPEAFLSPA